MSVKYHRNPQTAGRLIDGMAFVVTPDDNKLHTLNNTATKLWELAGEDDGCTVDSGASELVKHFQVGEAQAKTDVSVCLDDLVRRQILVASE